MSAAMVYLVDDDQSYLVATSRMLKGAGLVAQAFPSATSLLAKLTADSRGCVVADLSMPEIDGLELQARLAAAGVSIPIIFLSGHGDVPSTARAMRQGAVDFLEKHASKEQLLAAIHSALERDVAEYSARRRADELHHRFDRLTPREREVLSYVVRGRMNKQIAGALGINERTVKLHRTAITTKIGVHSGAELAVLAREAGLFEREGSSH
jgi:two-component system response regulator FixJ